MNITDYFEQQVFEPCMELLDKTLAPKKAEVPPTIDEVIQQNGFSVGMIYAQCANGGIGLNGKMPWSCKADFKHFWETIEGSAAFVGMNTYKSIAKLLHKHGTFVNKIDREDNFVKNRLSHFTTGQLIAHQAKKFGRKTNWVVGGAKTYEAALPYTHVIVATRILETYECDTFLPWTGVPEGFYHYDSFELETRADEPAAIVEIYVNEDVHDSKVAGHLRNLGLL